MLKKLTLGFVITLFMAASAAASVAQNVSAVQARELIAQQKPFLLDVRTPQEYFQIRLADSVLIPIDQLINRISEIPKDRPILIYCAVGSRSSQVSSYLAKNGYGPVYNLYGGIWAWQLRGYPVLQGAP